MCFLCDIITDNLCDAADIKAKVGCLFGRSNILLRKFYYCSQRVMNRLFAGYCSNLNSEFVKVSCPSIGWSPSTSFLVVWSPSGDMRGPSVIFEAVDDHFHYGDYINYCGFFPTKKTITFFMDLYFSCNICEACDAFRTKLFR